MRFHRQAFPVSVIATALLACANPADDKPEAKVGDAIEATKQAVSGTRFTFDDTSTLGFVGSKVTGSHQGGFRTFSGAITVPGTDLTKASVEVDIDATTLWADNEKLTGHLKSPDFFDVATYPTARFESTSISADLEGFTLTGNLTLHGVTKSVSFPAAISMTESGVRATAEFVIQRFDFGIAYKGKADDLIRDEVVIQVDLSASPVHT